MFRFNVSLDFLRIWLLFPSLQVSKHPNLPSWTLSPFSLVLRFTTLGPFLFLFTHRSRTVTFELRADSVNHVQLAFLIIPPYEYWLHQIHLLTVLILTAWSLLKTSTVTMKSHQLPLLQQSLNKTTITLNSLWHKNIIIDKNIKNRWATSIH